jgi:DNA-binding XRE family transcriptional regulator
MMFTERLKQICGELQLPIQKLAEALDIDSATYCKVESGLKLSN